MREILLGEFVVKKCGVVDGVNGGSMSVSMEA